MSWHPPWNLHIAGAELRAARKRAGWTQAELARRTGLSRHSVYRWEGEAVAHGVAAGRMIGVLREAGAEPRFRAMSRARGMGFNRPVPALTPALEAMVEAKFAEAHARALAREAARAARLRVPCGATTRKGLPCRALSEPGRRRCKFHGGRSTGPRTPEGKARIAEAQRALGAVAGGESCGAGPAKRPARWPRKAPSAPSWQD